LLLSLTLTAGAWPLRAADRTGGITDSSIGPSEYGLRFTPGMARGIARRAARDVIVKRYEMDPAAEEQLTDAIARRLMQTAHELDTPELQKSREQLLATFLESLNTARGGRPRILTPELGTKLGKHLLPNMPAFRELVRNVGRDLRPMLSMKQQLRLAADLATVKTGMDAFETTMQKWSTGQVDPEDHPFRPRQDRAPKLDAEGLSGDLKRARESAGQDKLLEKRLEDWERYVREAGELYGFDASQAATADSILRECRSRAEAVAQDSQWKAHRYQSSFSLRFFRSLGRSFRSDGHPVTFLLLEDSKSLTDPLEALSGDLKQRIERIPRADQKRAAQKRLQDTLLDMGLDPDTDKTAMGGPSNP